MNTNQSESLKRLFQKMGNFGFLKTLQLMWCQGVTFLKSKAIQMKSRLKEKTLSLAVQVTRWNNEMLTAIDKGVKAAELTKPPAGVYGDVDLRVLPQFISFKAATLREKLNLQYVILLGVFAWAATFLIQNNRIDYWQTKYREKEFILVPSKIVGHTPAVPQTVPKEYVKDAFDYFIQMQGTTTPSGIRNQLENFASYMEKGLSSKYLAQVDEWITLCEKKGIYEQVEITKLDFEYNKNGVFKAEILLRRDRRENSDFLGTAMEKIEMTMTVQPPKPGQAWAFEITDFSKKVM